MHPCRTPFSMKKGLVYDPFQRLPIVSHERKFLEMSKCMFVCRPIWVCTRNKLICIRILIKELILVRDDTLKCSCNQHYH